MGCAGLRSVRGRSGLASSFLGCHQGDGFSVLADRVAVAVRVLPRIVSVRSSRFGGSDVGGG